MVEAGFTNAREMDIGLSLQRVLAKAESCKKIGITLLHAM